MLAEEEQRRRDSQLKKDAISLAIRITMPVPAQKKINSESKFGDRFIWLEPLTGSFYWSKTATEGAASKHIDIKTHVARVDKGYLSDTEPNFSVILRDASNAPGIAL